MPSTYPGSLDSFSNPTGTQSQSASRTHSEQHGDLNDAVEALQATLGTTGSAGTPIALRSDLASADVGKGGELISFLQSGNGASIRSILAKLREQPVSVFDFIPVAEHAAIAARTSTYDCTADVQDALIALQSRNDGGRLYWPAGKYKVTGTLTYTGKPFSMEGEAPEMVLIDSYATGDLFSLQLTGGIAAVGGMAGATFGSCTIRNMVVTPKAVSTGAAFHIDYTQDTGGFCFLTVENIRLCRENTTYFKHGLHLNDVGSGIIRNTTIYFYGDDSDTCIFIDNSLTIPSYGVKFEAIDLNGADVGLKVNGWLESLYIGPGSAIVGSTDAIVLDGTGTTYGCPHFFVSGAHLNAKRTTIKTTNWRSILLSGVDVYHGVGTGDVVGSNIEISAGAFASQGWVQITGCKVETGTPALVRSGIVLNGIQNFAITGNTVTGFIGSGIQVFGTGARSGSITGNVIRGFIGGTRGAEGIYSDANPVDVSITGNVIENYVKGVGWGANLATITGNVIRDCTTGVDANSTCDARGNRFGTVTTEVAGGAKREFTTTATVDPPSVPAGGGATALVAITGAALGDFVDVSPPYDMNDVLVTAQVQSAGFVSLYFWNRTGAAVDKASGSWKFRIHS